MALPGTIYKAKLDGTGYSILKHFQAPDGFIPFSGVVLNGNTLYGTTRNGGSLNYGTVFKVDADGNNFEVLKHFDRYYYNGNVNTNEDGAAPEGGVILDGDTLYGTTTSGGFEGAGVVFKVKTDGSAFSVLRHMENPVFSDLVRDGNTLYGTTLSGGTGSGTVFRLSTAGTEFAVLKNFSSRDFHNRNSDGAWPCGVVFSGGTLYGTTRIGGPDGRGVVFKLGTDGSGFTVLRHFSAIAPNLSGAYTNDGGASPAAGLLVCDNTLYGTTMIGGRFGFGVIFRLVPPPPPQILFHDGQFGVRSNAFGFTVTGRSNDSVVVEASPNLSTPNWESVQTNILSGEPVYFRDAGATNQPSRFYRLRTLQ